MEAALREALGTALHNNVDLPSHIHYLAWMHCRNEVGAAPLKKACCTFRTWTSIGKQSDDPSSVHVTA